MHDAARHLVLALALVGLVATGGCIEGVEFVTPEDGTQTGPGEPTVVDPGSASLADPGVPADGEVRRATVTRVVDGDTVDVRYADGTNDTVRMIGIDAPETHAANSPGEFDGVPDTTRGRRCLREAGQRATDALAALVANETVLVVDDPNLDDRGRYGRRLAYLGLGVDDGAESERTTNRPASEISTANYRLVVDGHARVYDSPFTVRDAFERALASARNAGRGLWSCAVRGTASAAGKVSVSVHADAPGHDGENPNGEYVTLANEGAHSLAVGNWTVTDAAGRQYRFPERVTLPAGEHLRLYSGSGTDGDGAYYWAAGGAVWNNDGDVATVRNATGHLVARVSY